jgi:hypothetical protein
VLTAQRYKRIWFPCAKLNYELAVNGIGARCLPIDDRAALSDDFFRWFECEVASLPEVFADVNENFVAIVCILHMLKQGKCAHLYVLQTVASTCRTSIFSSIPRDVKKATRRIIKEWWRQHGCKEAMLVARARLHDVSSI